MEENKSNDTNDFLKELEGEEFFSDISGKKNSSQVIPAPAPAIVAVPVSSSKDALSLVDETPSLTGEGFPPEYMRVVSRIQVQYACLPKLNYDAIYREISELSIKSSSTPTLQVLNDELHKVQAAKDRLSEILIDVIKCYNFKNRAVDILKDSWGKFTAEKNTEGRKGDATFRLSDFLMDFALIEALMKSCNHVFKNLDSLHDNLSRRITIYQLILKLRDMGRGALPDFDFDKSAVTEDMFGDKNKEDSDKENQAKSREISLENF